MVERIKERPIVATLTVLLPVLVAAYVQLMAGLSAVEGKAGKLANDKREVEGKAGQLERATIKTTGDLANELEGLRQAAASQLASLYSEQARARQTLQELQDRIVLIEDSCLNEEDLLRARARRKFPGANIDNLDSGILRRLLGVVVPGQDKRASKEEHKTAEKAADMPEALSMPIDVQPQDQVF